MCEMTDYKTMAVELLNRAEATKPVGEALHHLAKTEMVFVGQESIDPYENVNELLRTYRIRLEIVSKQGLVTYGMEEFISCLSSLSSSERIVAWPFRGDGYAVTLFVTSKTDLVGCVVVAGIKASELRRL